MTIEAMVISVDDPQLDRCLEAVKNQTVPFSGITHINGVIPGCNAFNTGVKKVTGDYFMYIGGDFILNNDAVEIAMKYMEKDNDEKISGYYFALWDTFFDCRIGYASILRTSIYKTVEYENRVTDDWKVVRRLREEGWITKKYWNVLIGTHFDKPDEFQIFRRLYCHGTRFTGKRSAVGILTQLFEKTNDPIYSFAIKVVKFGHERKYYPGSHNIDFDRKMYEEFKGLN